MSVQLIGTPKVISFSRNPVLFKFKSDAQRAAVGAKARAVMYINLDNGNDVEFTISYGNQVLPFKITDNPTDDGYQIKKIWGADNHDDFIFQATESFKSNFYLNRDFDIVHAIEGGTTRYIVFTAKKPGSMYSLTCSMFNYTLSLSLRQPGIDEIFNKNFKIYYELWTENADRTGYEQKSSAYLEADQSGEASIDLSLHLTSALQADGYDRPNMKFPIASVDKKSLRAYYLQYAEVYGDTQVIRKINRTTTFYSLLGGVSNEMLEEFAFPDSFFSGEKLRFLKQESTEKYIRPEQPEFLTLVSFDKSFAQLQFYTKLYFTDNTNQELPGFTFPNVPKYTKLTVPVGFVQNNLHLVNGDKQVLKYQIYAKNELGNVITETKTYWLDYDFKSYTRYFLYLSSFGTYDTQFTYGKGSVAYDLLKQTATVTNVGPFQLVNGEQVDYATSLSNTETITTGYRERSDIRQFKDLFLSRDKFIVRKGRAYPVTLASKEIAEFKDGEDLVALSFEIGFQFKEQLWTLDEKDDMPAGLFFPIIVGGGGPANNLPPGYYDDRYYLKIETYNRTEIDNKLSAFNENIAAVNQSMETFEEEIQQQLETKAPVIHNHDDLYLPKADMIDLLERLDEVLDGGTTTSEDITFDVTIGAITPGNKIPKGTGMTDVLKMLAQKTFYPNLIAPNFALGHAEGANIEVGTTLDVDLVFTFNRGTIQATWPNGTNLPYAGAATYYTFYNSDETASVSTGGPNFTFPGYKVIAGSNLFKADVTYTAGQQPKDSKGENFGVPLAGGTSAKQQTSFNGLYKHFWGPVAAVPVAPADARLASNALSNSSSFTLNTGSDQKIFVILVAPGKSLSSVTDQDALNAPITAEYVYKGTVSVNDASGTPVPGYKLYVKNPDVAYTSNHRHLITLA